MLYHDLRDSPTAIFFHNKILHVCATRLSNFNTYHMTCQLSKNKKTAQSAPDPLPPLGGGVWERDYRWICPQDLGKICVN